MSGGIILPVVYFSPAGSSVVPASTLNDSASSPNETQLTVAAQNAPLRVIYGIQRVGGQLANLAPYSNRWVAQVIWGEGPLQSLDALHFNDEALPSGTTVVSYNFSTVATGTLGTNGVADATLVAAFAANGVTYTDTLAGVAYSVISFPAGESGMPQITATVHGRIVRNPGSAAAWSNNPALCLADFIESTVYGRGKTVNDTSLAAARDECNTLVSGVKRRTFGLTLDSPQGVLQWQETLRAYASCWVLEDAGQVFLVPDRPRATDFTVSHAAGQISKIGNLKKRGVAQVPTVIEIRYTDTSAIPWREASVWAYAPGVLSGSTERRDSQVALPGIQNASQAQREANERLNKLWLADLSFQCDIFDEGVKVQIGDVGEFTHPTGLSSKPMRVLGISGEYGRYSLNLAEYDPACYSDAVAADPTYADTNLPNPASPPALTGLTVAEEVFQLANGNYSSRIRLNWDAPVWPYLHDYSVTVEQGGDAIDIRRQVSTTYASPPIKEGVEYVCKVGVLSSIGASGAIAQKNITAAGKQLKPTFPAGAKLSCFEAGGRVYMSWPAAVDIDIYRYDIRYSTLAGTWDTATPLDRVDALRTDSDQIPVGTWKIWVDALDSVGKYTETPITATVVVTSDASAFLVDSKTQTAPMWQNLLRYSEQFDNSGVWGLQDSTISANAGAAPFFGATTADAIYETTANLAHRVYQGVATGSNTSPLTFSVYVKPDDRTTCRLEIYEEPTYARYAGCNYTLTGVGSYASLAGFGGAGSLSAGIESVDNGWYRVWITTTLGGTQVRAHIKLIIGTSVYVGTAGHGILVWGAQLSPHGNVQPYQVTTSAAVTEGGQNMASYTLAPTDTNTYYVTEDCVPFGTKFSSTMSTYTNALATYHASMTSTWLGESDDYGQLLGGQWTGSATVSALSGSLTSYMGFSADASTWTYYEGLSQKVNARFARLKHEALTTSTLMVTVPGQNIRIDAIPREEVGSGTSSASGPTTIYLANAYAAVKSISVTPEGATSRSATYDNVQINAFSANAIRMVVTNDATVGNHYATRRINAAVAYTIQTGDYIELDVLCENVAGAYLGIDLRDSSNVRILGYWNPTSSAGTWLSLKTSLASYVGQVIQYADVVNDSDTVSTTFNALFKNILITDGAGVIRKAIWNGGSILPNTTNLISSGTTVDSCVVVNAFDVYVFDAANAMMASPFRYQFKGV